MSRNRANWLMKKHRKRMAGRHREAQEAQPVEPQTQADFVADVFEAQEEQDNDPRHHHRPADDQ